MKLMQFWRDGAIRLGLVTKSGIVDVTATADQNRLRAPASMEELILRGTDALRPLAGVPPVYLKEPASYAPCIMHPQKILCVGLNYREHTAECREPLPDHPVLFSKFPNALAAHEEEIAVSAEAERLDYEAELVLVMGRRCKTVSEAEAAGHIFGYTCGNDISERAVQMSSSQWTMGKCWDQFAPIGPHIVTADALDVSALDIACRVNGRQMQRANTREMLFSPAEIVSYLSRYMTLEPGDLIFTGTPSGVMLGRPAVEQRWLRPDDVVEVTIEGIGTLRNRFVKEGAR